MFQFSGLAPFGDTPSAYRVAPFGNLRITGYFHLIAAYRRLSRPSSPLRAKASSIRPCLLSLYFTSNLYFLSNMSKNDFPLKESALNTGIEPVTSSEKNGSAHPMSLFINKKERFNQKKKLSNQTLL
jgi:hypothetical protein